MGAKATSARRVSCICLYVQLFLTYVCIWCERIWCERIWCERIWSFLISREFLCFSISEHKIKEFLYFGYIFFRFKKKKLEILHKNFGYPQIFFGFFSKVMKFQEFFWLPPIFFRIFVQKFGNSPQKFWVPQIFFFDFLSKKFEIAIIF